VGRDVAPALYYMVSAIFSRSATISAICSSLIVIGSGSSGQ
jgi:hypothetical protein